MSTAKYLSLFRIFNSQVVENDLGGGTNSESTPGWDQSHPSELADKGHQTVLAVGLSC